MSSLWTPDGEYKIPRAAPEGDPAGPRTEAPDDATRSPGTNAPAGSESRFAGRGQGDGADEEYPDEAELRAIAFELAAAPAEDVVANHCYGLFELAALHLSSRPPDLVKARVAIDAMGFVVDGLGDRLVKHAPVLAEGLAQLRLAFVRISSAGPAGNGVAPVTGDAGAPVDTGGPAAAGGPVDTVDTGDPGGPSERTG